MEFPARQFHPGLRHEEPYCDSSLIAHGAGIGVGTERLQSESSTGVFLSWPNRDGCLLSAGQRSQRGYWRRGSCLQGAGPGAEAGYAFKGTYNDAVGTGSIDGSYHFFSKKHPSKIEPFAIGGVSAYFGNCGAPKGFNVGGGVNCWVAKHVALRLEIRGNAHTSRQFTDFVAFRFGMTFR